MSGSLIVKIFDLYSVLVLVATLDGDIRDLEDAAVAVL
jgi:hypothetical protein